MGESAHPSKMFRFPLNQYVKRVTCKLKSRVRERLENEDFEGTRIQCCLIFQTFTRENFSNFFQIFFFFFKKDKLPRNSHEANKLKFVFIHFFSLVCFPQ